MADDVKINENKISENNEQIMLKTEIKNTDLNRNYISHHATCGDTQYFNNVTSTWCTSLYLACQPPEPILDYLVTLSQPYFKHNNY